MVAMSTADAPGSRAKRSHSYEFLRHDEIFRSVRLGYAPRLASASPCRGHSVGTAVMLGAKRRASKRERNPKPRSPLIVRDESRVGYSWRVALQQSPPPLYRPESMLHPPAETVNHHLLRAGEFSTGEMGYFQPALTRRPATVSEYLKAAETAGLKWSDVADWDDDRLWQAMARPGKAAHSGALGGAGLRALRHELQTNKYVTLQLLWEGVLQPAPGGISV